MDAIRPYVTSEHEEIQEGRWYLLKSQRDKFVKASFDPINGGEPTFKTGAWPRGVGFRDSYQELDDKIVVRNVIRSVSAVAVGEYARGLKIQADWYESELGLKPEVQTSTP